MKCKGCAPIPTLWIFHFRVGGEPHVCIPLRPHSDQHLNIQRRYLNIPQRHGGGYYAFIDDLSGDPEVSGYDDTLEGALEKLRKAIQDKTGRLNAYQSALQEM